MKPTSRALPPRYFDLLGEATVDENTYFDSQEFEVRKTTETRHYWHIYRNQLLPEVLERVAPTGIGSLIDIGCGVGTVTTHLNQLGYSVDYADIHETALRLAYDKARSELGERAERKRFIRMDISQNAVDWRYQGVLLLDVLEHLPDDVTALRTARSMLEGSDSFVVFTVPAFQFLWSSWDELEHHQRRYSLASARAAAIEAGFEVTYSTYFFAPLFLAASVVKVARWAMQRAGLARGEVNYEGRIETRTNMAVNRAILTALRPERWLLSRTRVPVGTSVLVVARPR